MKTYEELHNELIEELKSLTTADNIEHIQKINSSIQNMVEAHKTAEKENIVLKDKLVNMVNTSYTTIQPQNEPERPKTLEEKLLENYKKIKGGK